MAERKAWWEILRDQFASRGLLDPESERVQETVRALPAVRRQTRGLLSLDPQAESDTALEMGLGVLPGVGQAMALRDLERARRARDPGAAAMAASNFIPFGTLLNRFRRGPMSELDVYHGTPHTYAPTEANPLGEFDASKIGTGEGVQVYGYGTYLAEAPEVASTYRASVVPKDGRQFDLPDGPIKGIATMIAAKGDEGEKTARKLWASEVDDIDEAVRLAREAVTGKSSLYKADLPDEMIDRMLDWDKPLNEQNIDLQRFAPEMRKRIQSIPSSFGTLDVPLEVAADMLKSKTGLELYKMLAEQHGDKAASKMLKEAGIPGIKYLDAGSRGQGGSGTRNFVVFPGEEKKVKILERK